MDAERGDGAEAVGAQQRAVPRDRTAPVVADDDRGVDAARVEQADDVADEMELRVLVDARGHVGGAVAALVGREHVVAGVTQCLQLVTPRVPALGESVAEHDGGPVVGPGVGDVHADAVGVDVPVADHLSLHGQCSARSRSAVGSWVRSAPRNAVVSGRARCTSDSSWMRTASSAPRQSST